MNEIHLSSVNSTNTYAKERYSHFPKNQISCITAEEQTAGRGRHQRAWVSPRGVNIYATFYFQLPPLFPHLTALAQLMCYSLATILMNEGLNPKIKWPNDIQLNGKKISGILCETIFHKKSVEIFLGIGINVNMNTFEHIDQPATSLLHVTGKIWDRSELLKKLQKQFTKDLDHLKQEGFAPFEKLFNHLLAYKNKAITVFDGETKWTGICDSVSKEGGLNLLLPDKTIKTIFSGDVNS